MSFRRIEKPEALQLEQMVEESMRFEAVATRQGISVRRVTDEAPGWSAVIVQAISGSGAPAPSTVPGGFGTIKRTALTLYTDGRKGSDLMTFYAEDGLTFLLHQAYNNNEYWYRMRMSYEEIRRQTAEGPQSIRCDDY